MLYILSAANTIGIIRSTVSITFIINLDEMFYNACAPATMKASITKTAYEIKHSKLWYSHLRVARQSRSHEVRAVSCCCGL